MTALERGSEEIPQTLASLCSHGPFAPTTSTGKQFKKGPKVSRSISSVAERSSGHAAVNERDTPRERPQVLSAHPPVLPGYSSTISKRADVVDVGVEVP